MLHVFNDYQVDLPSNYNLTFGQKFEKANTEKIYKTERQIFGSFDLFSLEKPNDKIWSKYLHNPQKLITSKI